MKIAQDYQQPSRLKAFFILMLLTLTTTPLNASLPGTWYHWIKLKIKQETNVAFSIISTLSTALLADHFKNTVKTPLSTTVLKCLTDNLAFYIAANKFKGIELCVSYYNDHRTQVDYPIDKPATESQDYDLSMANISFPCQDQKVVTYVHQKLKEAGITGAESVIVLDADHFFAQTGVSQKYIGFDRKEIKEDFENDRRSAGVLWHEAAHLHYNDTKNEMLAHCIVPLCTGMAYVTFKTLLLPKTALPSYLSCTINIIGSWFLLCANNLLLDIYCRYREQRADNYITGSDNIKGQIEYLKETENYEICTISKKLNISPNTAQKIYTFCPWIQYLLLGGSHPPTCTRIAHLKNRLAHHEESIITHHQVNHIQ